MVQKSNIRIAQVLHVFDSSYGPPKLQVRLWEKFKEKSTQYHRSSNYCPNYIEMKESILLTDPSYKDQNDPSVVIFSKYIYKILFHIVKEKNLPYITHNIQISNG